MNSPSTIAVKVTKNQKIQKQRKNEKRAGMKTRKARPHAKKKRNKSESVQAQMPLLKNTLLLSQTV